MIHLIDPRVTPSIRTFYELGRPRREERPEYLSQRELIYASLVAIRTPSGLWCIRKSRVATPPSRPVRLATLKRLVNATLDAYDVPAL